MATEPQIQPVCIVVSRYNEGVTLPMRDGAIGEYLRRGGDPSGLGVLEAPGAFELPVLASSAVASDLYAGVVALGCVIKGETEHDRHISSAIAGELARLSAESGTPVAFGVLTVNTAEQARARAGGDKGNKGAEAMAAVLDVIAAQEALGGAMADDKPGVRFEIPAAAPDKTADGEAG